MNALIILHIINELFIGNLVADIFLYIKNIIFYYILKGTTN